MKNIIFKGRKVYKLKLTKEELEDRELCWQHCLKYKLKDNMHFCDEINLLFKESTICKFLYVEGVYFLKEKRF